MRLAFVLLASSCSRTKCLLASVANLAHDQGSDIRPLDDVLLRVEYVFLKVGSVLGWRGRGGGGVGELGGGRDTEG